MSGLNEREAKELFEQLLAATNAIPEEVFDDDDLENWAEENGFVKKDE
jgi:hypothetical protein